MQLIDRYHGVQAAVQTFTSHDLNQAAPCFEQLLFNYIKAQISYVTLPSISRPHEGPDPVVVVACIPCGWLVNSAVLQYCSYHNSPTSANILSFKFSNVDISICVWF